jgi:ABC-type branched-subunit amino acid transport system permease subunit
MTTSTPELPVEGGTLPIGGGPNAMMKGALDFVRRRWLLVLVTLIAALFPIIDGDQTQQTVIVGAGVFVLMALGLNIVVGYAGLLDLGYVAFFAIGAYSYAIANFGNIFVQNGHLGYVQPPNITPANATPIHLAVWPMLLGGLLIAAVFGVLLGAPTLRLRGDYLAIVTLGFGEIVPLIFLNDAPLGGAFGYTGLDLPSSIGPIEFTYLSQVPFYYFILALIIIAILVVLSLRNSRFGRAWIAIREDETAAAANGVNLVRTKLLAFGMGAALGGVAGVFYASHLTAVDNTQFAFIISVTVLVMVVLGGMGSIPGVILGALVVYFVDFYLLTSLNNFVHGLSVVNAPGAPLAFLSGFDFNSIKDGLFGLVLILMMILRPEGFIPETRRRRELHTKTAEPAVATVEAFASGSLDAPPGIEGNDPKGSLE